MIMNPEQDLEQTPLDAIVRAILTASLYERLGNDGFSQVYTSQRETLIDYLDETTDAYCATLRCYE